MAEIKNHRNTHGNLSRNLIKLKMAEIKNHRNTYGKLSRNLMKLKMVFTFLVGKNIEVENHLIYSRIYNFKMINNTDYFTTLQSDHSI